MEVINPDQIDYVGQKQTDDFEIFIFDAGSLL